MIVLKTNIILINYDNIESIEIFKSNKANSKYQIIAKAGNNMHNLKAFGKKEDCEKVFNELIDKIEYYLKFTIPTNLIINIDELISEVIK